MAYPCNLCNKEYRSEHAFITHWGMTHSNQLIERRLEALMEARRHHALETLEKQVQTLECSAPKPTT